MRFQIDEAVEVLVGTPSVLGTLLRGKSFAWLNARKTPDAFSAFEVLGHLIHGEKTDWIPRVRIILEHGDTQPFEPFDRFGFHASIAGKTIDELLYEFAKLRHESRGLHYTLDYPGLSEQPVDTVIVRGKSVPGAWPRG